MTETIREMVERVANQNNITPDEVLAAPPDFLFAAAADPWNFTRYDRTDPELEEMLLFSILVAGKRADQTGRKLAVFMECTPPRDGTAFEKVRELIDRKRLLPVLRAVRTGKYRLFNRAFRSVVRLDPRTCTLEDLEAVPGIGPKTARMFLLHSRPGQRLAALDTHILRYLRELGYAAPKTTPPAGPVYRRLEAAFLQQADLANVTPADLDLTIWKRYTKSKP